MKTVILAGGKGTRMENATKLIPKPMNDIGGKPILWHLLKIYQSYGFNDFIISGGYLWEVIKDYFDHHREMWNVQVVNTGDPDETNTGGRIKEVQELIGKETFMANYGDGLANIDLLGLIRFHKRQGSIATLTAVHPPGRFGEVRFGKDSAKVSNFVEKPTHKNLWINGGFFVFEHQIFDYLLDSKSSLELDCLPELARLGQLTAYRHEDFWQCMDTVKDKNILNKYIKSGEIPWKKS